MRPITFLWSLALGLALAGCAWLAAWVFLIGQEDYTPAPGTITYYLGISAVVRHAPLAGAVGRPEYYGTVGDGNKLPKSLVSYAIEPRDIAAALQAMDGYLRAGGWQPRPVETPGVATPAAPQGEAVLRHAEYASAAGEVVVLEVARHGTPERHALTLTHWH